MHPNLSMIQVWILLKKKTLTTRTTLRPADQNSMRFWSSLKQPLYCSSPMSEQRSARPLRIRSNSLYFSFFPGMGPGVCFIHFVTAASLADAEASCRTWWSCRHLRGTHSSLNRVSPRALCAIKMCRHGNSICLVKASCTSAASHPDERGAPYHRAL